MAIRYVDTETTPKSGEQKPAPEKRAEPVVAPTGELALGQDERPERPRRKRKP